MLVLDYIYREYIKACNALEVNITVVPIREEEPFVTPNGHKFIFNDSNITYNLAIDSIDDHMFNKITNKKIAESYAKDHVRRNFDDISLFSKISLLPPSLRVQALGALRHLLEIYVHRESNPKYVNERMEYKTEYKFDADDDPTFCLFVGPLWNDIEHVDVSNYTLVLNQPPNVGELLFIEYYEDDSLKNYGQKLIKSYLVANENADLKASHERYYTFLGPDKKAEQQKVFILNPDCDPDIEKTLDAFDKRCLKYFVNNK
jgi:hypothetical protein